MREAAEQVARAGCRRKQERSQDHRVATRYGAPYYGARRIFRYQSSL
jgi:hypothetical protein